MLTNGSTATVFAVGAGRSARRSLRQASKPLAPASTAADAPASTVLRDTRARAGGGAIPGSARRAPEATARRICAIASAP